MSIFVLKTVVDVEHCWRLLELKVAPSCSKTFALDLCITSFSNYYLFALMIVLAIEHFFLLKYIYILLVNY